MRGQIYFDGPGQDNYGSFDNKLVNCDSAWEFIRIYNIWRNNNVTVVDAIKMVHENGRVMFELRVTDTSQWPELTEDDLIAEIKENRTPLEI